MRGICSALIKLMGTLAVLSGTISQYNHSGSAIIQSNEMQTFCNPKKNRWNFGSSNVGKRVTISMGFSYDGLRVLDNSVDKVVYSDESDDDSRTPHRISVGDNVKCSVIENVEYYVDVKHFDYPPQFGGI